MALLHRTLGVPMLTFYGTGMILGAGIYSIIGKAASHTGETLWLGFIIAGLAAFFTALSYAELSTMYPKAGAEYVYLGHAFKKQKWIASATGIAMAFSGAATAATVALAFTEYLNQFFQVPALPIAVVLLMFFTIVSVLGVRISGWTNIVFTLIEISGLIIIIYLGFTSDKLSGALSGTPHLGTLSGAALIVFSYFGFENIVNLAEETKAPEKSLPKAILLSLLISSVLYFLVSISALALMTADALAKSDAALMSVAKTVSPKWATILGSIALFSTANTALISMVGASRVVYSMAKKKSVPQILSKVLPKQKTPWLASIAVLVVALVLIPIGKIEIVASVSSLATMLAFLLVNLAVIVLRITSPREKRPFKSPITIGKIPVMAVLGMLSSLLLLLQFQKIVYLVGGGFLLLCSLCFFWKEKVYK